MNNDKREYRRINNGPGNWVANIVIGLNNVQKVNGGKRYATKTEVTLAIKAHAESQKVTPMIIDGQRGE